MKDPFEADGSILAVTFGINVKENVTALLISGNRDYIGSSAIVISMTEQY